MALSSLFVVEDNPGDVELLRSLFSDDEMRCTLTFFDDGESALAALQEMMRGSGELPRLFLLDLNVPRVDGFKLLRYIRSHTAFDSRPVVVWSSSDQARDRDECHRLGATLYTPKPSTFDAYISFGGELRKLLDQVCV
jgi:CheY-like chemotaxis protein